MKRKVDEVIGRFGKATADVEEKKTKNVGSSRALIYVNTIRAQIGGTPLDPPTEATVSISDLAAAGVTVRIPAGGVTTVQVTGVGDWTYSSAVFTISLPGNKMALPIDLVATAPGNDGDHVTYDATFATPTYINALMGRYGNYTTKLKTNRSYAGQSKLIVESEPATPIIKIDVPKMSNSHDTSYEYVGANVSKLSWGAVADYKVLPQLTAILPNAAEMLSFASGDDRTLHQVPHTLGFGDTAKTADLADYFNDAVATDDKTAVFRLSSRKECVIKLRLTATRNYQAAGVVGDPLPDPLIISPWAATVLEPVRSAGNAPVLTLKAEVKADGPAQVGLREDVPAAVAQGVVLPPRTAMLQPFTLPATTAVSRRFSGVWLCLSGPPAEAETLQVRVVAYDSETQSDGETLATATADFSDRQMDLTPIGDGVFVQWVPFEESWDVDTPDLGSRFALVLSTASGPIPLLETIPTVPQLSPAFSRDFTRSAQWTKRIFGNENKVLMFELGEVAEDLDAMLTVQSDGVSQTYAVGSKPSDLTVAIPLGAEVLLSTDREMSFDMVEVTTFSAVDEIGV